MLLVLLQFLEKVMETQVERGNTKGGQDEMN